MDPSYSRLPPVQYRPWENITFIQVGEQYTVYIILGRQSHRSKCTRTSFNLPDQQRGRPNRGLRACNVTPSAFFLSENCKIYKKSEFNYTTSRGTITTGWSLWLPRRVWSIRKRQRDWGFWGAYERYVGWTSYHVRRLLLLVSIDSYPRGRLLIKWSLVSDVI